MQSRDGVAHSQNPDIVFQFRDCVTCAILRSHDLHAQSMNFNLASTADNERSTVDV